MEMPSYFIYIQGLFGLITAYILIKSRKENKKYINIPLKYRLIGAFTVILSLIIVVVLITKFGVEISDIYYYFYYSLMIVWFVSIIYFFSTRKVL